MQIIIDIPVDVYTRLFDNYIQDNEIATGDICEMARAIRKGKPLPNTFDLEGLKNDMKALNCGYPYGLDYLLDCLKKRLGITIIEADDCRTCNKWSECECGEEGHKNNTSIGYSVGECKDYKPCEDCISREQTKSAIRKACPDLWDRFEINNILNEMPSVNSQKIGYWKVDSDKDIIICCDCGTWFNNDRLQFMRHCPYCGIEMRGAYEIID